MILEKFVTISEIVRALDSSGIFFIDASCPRARSMCYTVSFWDGTSSSRARDIIAANILKK